MPIPSPRRFRVLISVLLFSVCAGLLLCGTAWAQQAPFSCVLKPTEAQKTLGNLSKDLTRKYVSEKSEAIIFALMNDLPIREELPNGQLVEIQAVRNGMPMYYITNNINAARTSGVNLCWPSGPLGLNLTGKGITLGEWDGGGVRTTHREFGGRVTQRDTPAALHYHSTHVAGTIMASGVLANARGMSYEGNLDAYEWTDDYAEMAAAAVQGLQASNHSYGLVVGWVSGFPIWVGDPAISMQESYLFGFYNEDAQAVDSVAYNAQEYLICWAAGNDRGEGPNPTIPGLPPRDGGETGFDCIPAGGSTAKNTLTVGAVQAIPGGYTAADGVIMSSFSSWGPCDDGRIKPDVVADGVNLLSTFETGDADYGTLSGTSMATPVATGSLGMIMQHFRNVRLVSPSAAMMKALVIHGAREAGPTPGPDYAFGWGLLSASNSVQIISNASTGRAMLIESTLTDGGIYTLDVLATGSEPLKATLVWIDPPGTPTAPALDPSTKMLVNNLELQISNDTATTLPWTLEAANPTKPAARAINNTDTVEQVVVDPTVTGNYQITVYNNGTLLGDAQRFALIVTGVSPRVWSLNVSSNAGSPVEIIGSHPGFTPYVAPVAEGSLVEIWAPETVGDLFFRRWKTADGQNLGSVPKLSFILERDTSIVAEYGTVPTGYSPLTVQSEPTGAPITGSYPGTTEYTVNASERTLTTLRAPMAHAGRVFSRWKTPAGVTLTDQSTYQFLVTGDKTVIAEYTTTGASDYTLLVQANVFGVPIGGTQSGQTNYSKLLAADTLITLVAPVEYGGNYFVRWSSDAAVVLSANPTYTFNLNANQTVVAEYSTEPPSMTLYSWGFNDWGQLGNGFTADRNVPVHPYGLGSTVAASVGQSHSLSIGSNGRIYAWGRNSRGQLGLSSTTEQFLTPTMITDLENAVGVAAGGRHSLAVLGDGTVWGWGSSSAGQVGDGEMVNRLYPIEVEGITDAVQVAAGMNHSLALTRDGTVWSWGVNASGQLGDGTRDMSAIPVQVNNLHGIVKIAAGANHNLALTYDGLVWGWGDNSWGQMGIGNMFTQDRPVLVSALTDIVDIAAGEGHSLALAADGTVYAWGANWWGQLGDNTDMTRIRPVAVVPAAGKAPVEISAGAFQSMARMSDGTAYAWGWNRHGQVGNSSWIDRHAGSMVSVIQNVSALADGAGNHSAAVADQSAAPPVPTNALWTFMVYMDADNNLEPYAMFDFLELSTVGSGEYRNIVVMLDRIPGYDSNYGDWTDTRIGRILQGDLPTDIWGESVGEANMGDPDTLAGFIAWTKANYPAEHYALVLWNHGDGWRVASANQPPPTRAVCWDDTDLDVLSIREVQGAFETATLDEDPLGVLGMDACLMGMVEVGYGLKDFAEVMVASEETVPGYGWPYTPIMEFLDANPTASPVSFAIDIVSDYMDYYNLLGYDATMSAIDLSGMDALAAEVDGLGTSLIDNWDTDPDAIATQAAVVIGAAQDAIISNMASAYYPGANGLAIYLPYFSSADADYNDTNVALAEDTSWDEFLDAYYTLMWFTWVDDASGAAQRFYDYDDVDLIDFCEQLIQYAQLQPLSIHPPLRPSASAPEPAEPDFVPPTTLAVVPPYVADAAPIVAPLVTVASVDGIVDNRDASTEGRFSRVRGLWPTSDRLSGKFRRDYAFAPSASGAETARARFVRTDLPEGEYEVYAWWPAGADRAVNAPYEIHHADGVTTVRADQTRNGGKWNLLGVFRFDAGGHMIEVHNGGSQPGAYVSADAVRFSQAK